MERITLANLHEQLDSLRSTSIPQVKRYFRKRIVKCINECKTQALNMKKSIETTSNASRRELPDPNDYEFGWGSDFDEDDEEEEEHLDQVTTTINCDSRSSPHVNIVHSLSNLHLNEASSGQRSSQLTHSLSLQSFSSFDTPNQLSSKSLCFSSPSNSSKRPITDPPPPPLPKEPPPSVIEEERVVGQLGSRKSGIDEDAYEIMTASTDNCDDEYLLPNSAMKSPRNTYLSNDGQENANYEYIQYGQMYNQPANSSDTGSILSSNSRSSRSSRSNLRFDSDIISERPLPPIPKENEQIEDLMLTSFSWFHDLERDEAEMILKRIGTDGVYLVRKSKRAGLNNPFTLTLYYSGRIFHLNVRRRLNDGLYALGKEKHKEKTFASVAELVEYHNTEPIFLTSKGQAAGKTRLIYTPSVNVTHSTSQVQS